MVILKSFKIALCQIVPEYNKKKSVEHAFELVKQAAKSGAHLVSLPELFYYPYELNAIASIIGDEAELLAECKYLARIHAIYLCTGSMAIEANGKLYNQSHLFGPTGDELLTYRKTHLFDVHFNALHVDESAVFTPGDYFRVVETPLGTIAILICYDIRFPEMARAAALAGAEILLVPAVFNTITGPAHWHLFMRTRAVENQLFLAAISQGRNQSASYKAYGHSIVVSPWGEVLEEAGEGEEIVYAHIDPELLRKTRMRLPLLQHRRDKLYTTL